jgi:3D (Asp-Asp-Asp) domain-containing protein
VFFYDYLIRYVFEEKEHMLNYVLKIPAFFLCFPLFFAMHHRTADANMQNINEHSMLEIILRSAPYTASHAIYINSELTAYCTEKCCNSGMIIENGESVYKDWSNKIAAGKVSMNALRAVGIDIAAVDTDIIPFGSIIKYDGKYYAALDRGCLIRGTDIDLAMQEHSAAEQFGRRKNQQVEVFVPADSKSALSLIFSIAESFAVNN